MRNVVKKITYQPKFFQWIVFFFFAFICTVVPLLGPAFLGFIIYRILKMGEVKQISDVFIPTIIGVVTHSLIFYLPSWPIENFAIVTVLNLLCLVVGGFWTKLVS